MKEKCVKLLAGLLALVVTLGTVGQSTYAYMASVSYVACPGGLVTRQWYYTLGKIYIPENDGKTIRVGAITDDRSGEALKANNIDSVYYECVVVDYDYKKYGTKKYPAMKRFEVGDSLWMEYEPSHPGRYGFCWREYQTGSGSIHNSDGTPKQIRESWAECHFEGNKITGGQIFVPDRNAKTLRFGMVFDAPHKEDVHITWYLYKPDEGVYEAILSDGTVGSQGVWQSWTKRSGRYWIMCRITSNNNPESTTFWGVEVQDGIVK